MQKLFYLLFDDVETPGSRLREALVSNAAPKIKASGASEVFVFVNDEDVAEGNCIRRSDPPIRAFVSFWLEDAADRAAAEEALAAEVSRIAGYLVLESRPMVHDLVRGSRGEGMKQITCVTKRADITQEEFISIWHEDHRKVAIETQSTFGYVRNEIFRPLTPDAPDCWTAIVEESFPTAALSDPKVFYDARDEEEFEANFKRMMESCDRFLDPEPMEVTYVSEYYLG
jgi:hypothetical protein